MRAARQILVWLHVLTSVGWMSQALALFTLLSYGMTAGDRQARHSAYAMAEVLDAHVLLYLANASAFTGIMLAALTRWGFFVHWWVLTKFAITLSQLYVGIALLSPDLAAAARVAGQGGDPPVRGLLVASLPMVSAICRPAAGSHQMLWYAVAVPVADYLIGTFVLGVPMVGFALLTAVGYPIWRAYRLSSRRRR